jgi:hypothetical protein
LLGVYFARYAGYEDDCVHDTIGVVCTDDTWLPVFWNKLFILDDDGRVEYIQHDFEEHS